MGLEEDAEETKEKTRQTEGAPCRSLRQSAEGDDTAPKGWMPSKAAGPLQTV